MLNILAPPLSLCRFTRSFSLELDCPIQAINPEVEISWKTEDLNLFNSNLLMEDRFNVPGGWNSTAQHRVVQ